LRKYGKINLFLRFEFQPHSDNNPIKGAKTVFFYQHHNQFMQITTLSLANHRVLLRVDFNVPMDADGFITDDSRIRAALPTIDYLIAQQAKVILISHLGRPKKDKEGKFDKLKFGLGAVAAHLSELVSTSVLFADDCLGAEVEEIIGELQAGEILLLENVRFYPEEEAGDKVFAEKLSKLADIYINDAFGTAHRDHASTCTVAQFFAPERKAFGFLMEKEVESGKRLLQQPKGGFIAIIGGAKVSDKILLLRSLLGKVESIIIGGAMAFTFIKAQGGNVGKSLVETDKLDLALALLSEAKEAGVEILLPVDALAADSFDNNSPFAACNSADIPSERMGLDIGEKTQAIFAQVIAKASTIFWNGPMGVFEFSNFAQGTAAVAQAVVTATQNGAFSLVGGGDSVAALQQMGKGDEVSFISTGGGAMLELIENGDLVGVAAIGS